jgi:hypothetical protein
LAAGGGRRGAMGRYLTLTGNAVCFLFRSLSLWCRLASTLASSACCFLSSLRWLSVKYTRVHHGITHVSRNAETSGDIRLVKKKRGGGAGWEDGGWGRRKELGWQYFHDSTETFKVRIRYALPTVSPKKFHCIILCDYADFTRHALRKRTFNWDNGCSMLAISRNTKP